MDTRDAIAHMMGQDGKSAYATSMAMGERHSYVTSILRRKGLVSAPVLADVARACGYRLQLTGHGETIDIDGRPTG